MATVTCKTVTLSVRNLVLTLVFRNHILKYLIEVCHKVWELYVNSIGRYSFIRFIRYIFHCTCFYSHNTFHYNHKPIPNISYIKYRKNSVYPLSAVRPLSSRNPKQNTRRRNSVIRTEYSLGRLSSLDLINGHSSVR